MIDLLISKGADVNSTNEYGQTALFSDLHTKVLVETLIANGADPTLRARGGITPLHLAKRADVVEILLAHGAEINSRTEYGFTPLHYAATDGSLEVLEILLEHGADVNATNTEGSTPMKLIRKKFGPTDYTPDFAECVRRLEEHGGHY